MYTKYTCPCHNFTVSWELKSVDSCQFPSHCLFKYILYRMIARQLVSYQSQTFCLQADYGVSWTRCVCDVIVKAILPWTKMYFLQRNQGAESISRCHLTSKGNPIVEIRRSYDRLISTMGFPILVRQHLYIESGPSLWPFPFKHLRYVHQCFFRGHVNIIHLGSWFTSLLQHHAIVSGPFLTIVGVMLTFTGSEAEHATLHLRTDGRSLYDVRILGNQRVRLCEIGRGEGHLGSEEVHKPCI